MAKPNAERQSRPRGTGRESEPENRADLRDHTRTGPEAEAREAQMDEADRTATR